MLSISMFRDAHQLASRHFQQVVRRPRRINDRLRATWALTFMLKGGQLLQPLGATSMLVLYSSPNDMGERLPEHQTLLCLTAKINPQTAEVCWRSPVMHHDLSRQAYSGARGATLDPRHLSDPSVRHGQRPNARWLSLALEADAARESVQQNHLLEMAPQLPQIWIGYTDPVLAPFCDTPALRHRVAAHMQRPVTELDHMSQLERDLLLRAEWPSLFWPPTAEGNTTGMYLLAHTFVRSLVGSARQFEDFTDLIGQVIPNPLAELLAYEIPNPATVLADAHGYDLADVLKVLADSAASATSVQQATRICEVLEERIRANLGELAKVITDIDIEMAVVEPHKRLKVCPEMVERLDDATLLAVFRAMLWQISPHVLEGLQDEDLVRCVNTHPQALVLPYVAAVQVLYRNPELGADHCFRFGPAELGRHGLHLSLVHEEVQRVRANSAVAEVREAAQV